MRVQPCPFRCVLSMVTMAAAKRLAHSLPALSHCLDFPASLSRPCPDFASSVQALPMPGKEAPHPQVCQLLLTGLCGACLGHVALPPRPSCRPSVIFPATAPSSHSLTPGSSREAPEELRSLRIPALARLHPVRMPTESRCLPRLIMGPICNLSPLHQK